MVLGSQGEPMKCKRHPTQTMLCDYNDKDEQEWYCPRCWWLYIDNMPPSLFEAKAARQIGIQGIGE
ncbi:hypothetical protein LCGC14_0424890 [marine sediment metagenome]|uniref:Uncharacterized protein n=1 Tax=marine sediment metagenome TaxID=412755 RepID=A0A0F9T7W8_9ZZZZ